MHPDERSAWVALGLAPGIGPARHAVLVEAFSTATGALSAPFEFLRTVPGMSKALASALRQVRPAEGARAIARVEELGGKCLIPGDPDWPELLSTIPEPPCVLFCQGNTALLGLPSVAIVGSRDHTSYGARVTEELGREAAAAGLVTVSGMARGLDAVAHAATLDAGGKTIGVLGNGLGVIYPAANRKLYERVMADGVLVSEFAPGEKPHAGSFPRRNRLISGLARATVVVEAAARSGTLITVGTALEQGRDVLAVPGPITSPTSTGTNRLIADGAIPYLGFDDLARLFEGLTSPPGPLSMHGERERDLNGEGEPDLPAAQRELFDLCKGKSLHVDTLAESTSRPVHTVLADLAQLEIAGLVVQEAGRLFRTAG